jgi:hypothetical protein
MGGARPKVPWTDKGSTVFTSLRISGNGSMINNINGSTACPNRQDCVVTPWTEFTEWRISSLKLRVLSGTSFP